MSRFSPSRPINARRICAILFAGVVALPGAALAQSQPSPMPWDRAIERYYNYQIQDPISRKQKALERLLQDPALALESDFQAVLRKLGLPPNAVLVPEPPELQTPEIPIAGFEKLDLDGNGALSRAEYLNGRRRMFRAGGAADARRAMAASRLSRQFRRADWNGDGKLTGDELLGVRNPRF